MRQKLTSLPGRDRGFSLVEVAVATAIALTVLSMASSEVRRSLELKKLVENQDVLTDLETKIRLAAKDPRSLNYSATKATILRDCLANNGQDCGAILQRSKSKGTQDGQAFPLFLVSGDPAAEKVTPLTGGFDGAGRSCSAGCPIEVKTTFYGVCKGDDAQCDVASTIVVNYAIEVDDRPLRSSLVSFKNAVEDTSDDNDSCGLDADQNPRFAYRVSSGAVSCVDVPPPVRRLVGANPGACVVGKEVMVGIDPATKNVICAPIVFKEGL